MEDHNHGRPTQPADDLERRLEDVENRLLELQQYQQKQWDGLTSETEIFTLKINLSPGANDDDPSVEGSLLGVKFKLFLSQRSRHTLYIDVLNINELLRGQFCKRLDVTFLHPLGGRYTKRTRKILSNVKVFKHKRLLDLGMGDYFESLVRPELDVRIMVEDYSLPPPFVERVRRYFSRRPPDQSLSCITATAQYTSTVTTDTTQPAGDADEM